MTAALVARDVCIGYGGTPVVDAMSLAIDKQDIACLLGGSGCGKSTLPRGLAGLAPLQQGGARFPDAPLRAPHPRAALVFQQPSLLPWLDVAGNVGVGLDFARQPAIDRSARDQRVQAAIDAVGLAERGDAFPAQLSGGRAQRVALAHQPGLPASLLRAGTIALDDALDQAARRACALAACATGAGKLISRKSAPP